MDKISAADGGVLQTNVYRAYNKENRFESEFFLKRIYTRDNKCFYSAERMQSILQPDAGLVKLEFSQAMTKQLILIGTLSFSLLYAQRVTDQRTADIRGGGGEGKCTIEVVVDDVAEVDIFGTNMAIRTINGAPATIRRFVCNQAMPNRPVDFRFKGIDGRGRQELLRSAENGGRAIVRIEDSKGGSEGYTFDIFWRGSGGGGGSVFGNGNGGGNNGGSIFGNGGNRPGNGGYVGGGNRPGSGGYEDDWNNGWGNGNGWITNGNFNFEGGGRGSGSYRDRNGNTRRLDRARVNIANNGQVNITFQSEDGTIDFSGRVDHREGRRVYADVRGSGMFGIIELEMSARDRISRIRLDAVGLNWRN